jgi:hypothetical protein
MGSVWAAKKAIEDFGAAAKGMKVEFVAADHLSKPDVGSSIARQWFDLDKVDAIADVPTSSVGLAVNEITREKNKVFLAVGPATSDLNGKACAPNTVHWIYDTWALANGTGTAVVKQGGDTWFFVTGAFRFRSRARARHRGCRDKERPRCSARFAIPSPDRTFPRSCYRPKRLRPRTSAWRAPAAIP